MLTRAEEKLLFNLRRRKTRAEQRLFLAEGQRVVAELLGSGVRPRLAVIAPTFESSPAGREWVARLEAACEVRRVEDHVLARVAATEAPQGIVVVAEVPERPLASITLGESALVLVLDGVQDPGNLGALVRTAAAFNAAAAVVLRGSVDPWNPKAVRASAGAAFRVPIASATPEALSTWLDREGITLYGADVGGDPVEEVAIERPAALAVGNEGAGLSEAVRSRVASLVAVPMTGSVESLNVAVAAGILMYLMTRGR